METKPKKKNKWSEYEEALSFVDSVSNISFRKNYGSKKLDPVFFLERTKYFLRLIGNPEKDFRYVHITGTAGKGSVSNMVHNILSKAGIQCGLFTSPYVTCAIEKIKVGKLYIAPHELVAIVEYLRPFVLRSEKSKLGRPSSFELFLAIAFIYFKQSKCKLVVLEAGLGGRYDATNVITHSISAITNIDYDHTEILGKTLKEIAYDKVGIIKKNSLFLTSEQRPSLKRLFGKVCREKNAIPHFITRQKSYMDYNRTLASQIAESLKIDNAYIQKGIQASRLPCRFEIIATKPFTILDGAHNRAKIKSTIFNLKAIHYKRLILVLAVAETNKDKRAILKPLIPLADFTILTSLQASERKSVHPNFLMERARSLRKKDATIEIVMDPKDAIEQAMRIARHDDCVLVTGSFFLAGEIRRRWYSEEWILKNRKSFKD